MNGTQRETRPAEDPDETLTPQVTADLYDDVIAKIKFETLSRAEQYAQLLRIETPLREENAGLNQGLDDLTAKVLLLAIGLQEKVKPRDEFRLISRLLLKKLGGTVRFTRGALEMVSRSTLHGEADPQTDEFVLTLKEPS